MPPAERALNLDRIEAAARALLTAGAFEAAFARGAQAPVEPVVAGLLEDVEAAAPAAAVPAPAGPRS